MTLIDRLSKLDRPDREVDGEIMQTFDPDLWAKAYIRAQEPCGCSKEMATEGAKWRAPQYTASVDAAIVLAERLFPGTEYEFTNLYNIVRVTIEMNGEYGGFHGEHVNSLPIAICIAILRAKEASHGE